MSIAILPTSLDIYLNGSTTFTVSGGTAPYTFAMVSGKGTIDASTGVYTASPVSGRDVVKVTDSLAATTQATVNIYSAITLFADIIRHEMDLLNTQVYLYNQKIKVPEDEKIYIAIGIGNAKPFGNTQNLDGTGSGLNEVLSANFMTTLSIDVMSRGSDARDRKEEIVLALQSNYSQQRQEKFGFYIAPLTGSFVNLSSIEGAAIPNRFSITCNIQYKAVKTKAIDYYETFPDVETTIEA